MSRKGSNVGQLLGLKRGETIDSQASGLRSRVGINTDIDSVNESSNLGVAKKAGESKMPNQRNDELAKKMKEWKDPDQMALLTALNVTETDDDLEEKIAAIADFPITVDKRDVWKLLEEYEQRNTRMVIDVNTGEYDLVIGNTEKTEKDAELRQKIKRVSETISVLKKRKLECDQRYEFFSAPKKAEAAKKKEKETNSKKVRPKFQPAILQIHNL